PRQRALAGHGELGVASGRVEHEDAFVLVLRGPRVLRLSRVLDVRHGPRVRGQCRGGLRQQDHSSPHTAPARLPRRPLLHSKQCLPDESAVIFSSRGVTTVSGCNHGLPGTQVLLYVNTACAFRTLRSSRPTTVLERPCFKTFASRRSS